MRWITRIPWYLLVAGSLTLGLAPFVPEPHLVEKVRMLLDGELSRPIDVFDLALHGAFPVLLALRVLAFVASRWGSAGRSGR